MYKPSLAAAICFYYRHVNLRVRKHDRVAEELIPHEMKLRGTFKAQKITGNGNEHLKTDIPTDCKLSVLLFINYYHYLPSKVLCVVLTVLSNLFV